MISPKKRAAIELLLFIFILTLPGFIFGLFLDLVIFKEVTQADEFIKNAERIINIGLIAVFICAPSIFKRELFYTINFLLSAFFMLNFILDGELWFIIQPLLTLAARFAWILDNLIGYVWSLFWGLITIWVVICWINLFIKNYTKASETEINS